MPRYYLNTQNDINPYNPPRIEDIIFALQGTLEDTNEMLVLPLRGPSTGVYEIDLPNGSLGDTIIPVTIPGKGEVRLALEAVDIPIPGKYNAPGTDHQGSSVGEAKDKFFFKKKYPQQTDRTGTLITFNGCTRGPLNDISNKSFDDVIKEHGVLNRLTEFQRHKGTSCFNGNRFCVLEPRGTIPDKIQVPGPNGQWYVITLRFRGQSYFCATCRVKHEGQCPVKAEFYQQKDLRAEQPIKIQIVSDSTLRQADQLGLIADLTCMSGGRAGNIANVLLDNPSIKDKTDVIVMAGLNDILLDEEPIDEFVRKTETAISKMTVNLFGTATKLHIVPPFLPPNFDNTIRHKKHKAYTDILQRTRVDPQLPFNVLPITQEYMEFLGIHPTIAGTEHLLNLIDEHIKIIRNDDFITCTNIYQGCTSLVRYGCLMCNETFGIRNGYCQKCQDAYDTLQEANRQKLAEAEAAAQKAAAVAAQKAAEQAKAAAAAANADSATNEVDMINADTKRSHSQNEATFKKSRKENTNPNKPSRKNDGKK